MKKSKYIISCSITLIFLITQTSFCQEKSLEVSLGTLKTELKQNAIDFGLTYVKSLDSVFKKQDILLAGNKSLFQITPRFNVQSGTNDAFSSIDVKLSGLLMFFNTTNIAGAITPCTDCIMHLFPISFGIETNNTFTVVNGILEFGYVPWYQSPMMKNIPNLLKHTKTGIFLQTGYKFDIDNSDINQVGGQLDESEELLNEAVFRAKFNFAVDTKSLFEISSVGIGLVGSSDLWYDIVNNKIYYRIEGKTRIFLTENKDKYFDLKYQKGSGAPNFNQGDQFGMGLTLTF